MYFGLKYILWKLCVYDDLSLMSKRLFNARVGTAHPRSFLMHFPQNIAGLECYAHTAMQTVPAVNKASPAHAFGESLSLKTTSEKNTVINRLNLSTGTTTLTCPCRIA